ncbi:MAG TPA: ATP-dependent DNA ligase [Vicinamibacteria bacterium]|nr:ATP-dependent DNA ligase [Vicinamibacteria bacterium]
MLLAQLVELVGRIRGTTKKTEKVALIAEALGQTKGRETELLALYLTGTLPQGRIGFGWRTIETATTERPAEGAPLTLADVDETMSVLATEKGAGSADRRTKGLRGLFERADEAQRRFLVELLMGEVRQGALDGLVLEAIGKAAGLPAATVRQAAMFAGNLGETARVALEDGAAGLGRYSLRVLQPVAPMLANPAEDVEEALERLGEAAFEYKLDGARIQLHKAGDDVRVFTRQLQDVTDRVPEITEWARGLTDRELVLEGEAIALRPDGRPHPFQVTMRRFGRSKGVAEARRELPLSAFFFDALLAEGEGALVGLPYAERFARLARMVPTASLLPRQVTSRPDEAASFLRASLDAGHEGLMAKSLLAPYTAGQRGYNWLKLKQARTLDLVVLAVEWGSGRRKGWLSNLHLGARDAESGQFVMLGKTFKGLTDAMLRWQTEKLLSLETGRDQWSVQVRPELVVEIAFNDVQESPRYPAGLALRFARVKRYREDKPASEADTVQTVRAIFDQQRM